MQPQPRPDPDDPRAVLIGHLKAHEWGIVMAALRKQPFEIVASILGNLSEQFRQQRDAAASDAPPQPQE